MFEYPHVFFDCILVFCYIVCSSGMTFLEAYSMRVYNNVTKNSTKRLHDVTRKNSNIEHPSKIFVVFGLNLALWQIIIVGKIVPTRSNDSPGIAKKQTRFFRLVYWSST